MGIIIVVVIVFVLLLLFVVIAAKRYNIPSWLRTANIFNLLPIIVSPLLIYASVFLSDDPNGNTFIATLVFYAMLCYPFLLVIMSGLSIWIYKKYKSVYSVIPLIFSLPLYIIVAICLFL